MKRPSSAQTSQEFLRGVTIPRASNTPPPPRFSLVLHTSITREQDFYISRPVTRSRAIAKIGGDRARRGDVVLFQSFTVKYPRAMDRPQTQGWSIVSDMGIDVNVAHASATASSRPASSLSVDVDNGGVHTCHMIVISITSGVAPLATYLSFATGTHALDGTRNGGGRKEKSSPAALR